VRAAVQERYGPPEVVRVTDVPTPVPGADDLLIRVSATTVNRTDCAYRAARPFVIMRLAAGLTRPRRPVLGCEFAGVVAGVGGGVTSFAVGDRVFGWVEGRFGAHAEYLAVPETASMAITPATVPDGVAAAATEGSHYALSVIRGTRVRAGHDVLVNGATGAIGSAAVQLLRNLGARVTAVCGPESLDLVRSLGADRVIDRTAEDFTRDDASYDVVIDAVGKSTFGRCRRLLKPGGRYASSELGPRAQNPFLALVTPLARGRRVVFPIPRDDPRMMAEIGDLMAAGSFRPLVDRRYPLEQIVDAYRYVETGQKTGSVVIEVAPPA
jgi:NADPH:quinone reductase-like Zn-dependent oxidoreductase